MMLEAWSTAEPADGAVSVRSERALYSNEGWTYRLCANLFLSVDRGEPDVSGVRLQFDGVTVAELIADAGADPFEEQCVEYTATAAHPMSDVEVLLHAASTRSEDGTEMHTEFRVDNIVLLAFLEP